MFGKSFLILNSVLPSIAYCESYLTADQAAKVIFGDVNFKSIFIKLTQEDIRKIEISKSYKNVNANLNLLVSTDGKVVFLDRVIGKHEMITYAVGINNDGKIQGVEILEYREAYGHQIRREVWRKQFVGKDKSADIRIDSDIKNISGATLSCANVTEGVKKLVIIYEQIKNRIKAS